jgi:chemotaxis protein CheC
MTPTAEQLDALCELLNLGMGHAAGLLSDLTGTTITLEVPSIKLVDAEDLHGAGADRTLVSSVGLDFRGRVSGRAALVFPPESARNLVALVNGDAAGDEPMDEMRIGVLSEVGNIILNAVMGAMSNMLDAGFEYSVAEFSEEPFDVLIGSQSPANGLVAQTRFSIQSCLIQGEVLVLLEIGALHRLLAAVDRMVGGLRPT